VRRLSIHRQPVDLQRRHLELGAANRRSGFVVNKHLSSWLRRWRRGQLDSLDQAETRGLAHRLDAVAGFELVHRLADVLLDRVAAEEETLADLGVCQTLCDQCQHPQFLTRELGRTILRHLAAIVVPLRISIHLGGVKPATRGLSQCERVHDRGDMRKRVLASAACVLLVGAGAALVPTGAHADDAVAEQTSESSASSSATNDNSVSQSATATQNGGGGQSQTIAQSAPAEQASSAAATSTQSPAGGSSAQHNSSGSSANGVNTNGTTQAATQDQSASPTSSPSSGTSQGSTQNAPSNQTADAGATSTQVGPTNVNVVIRVDSPGNDGPVTQTNLSTATAVSGNTNAVSQDAAQNQTGAGTSGGQAQSAGQTAPATQDSQATADSTQVAPLNANIVVRNKSPGDGAAVTQTNTSQATAQAANQNAVNQSADQTQTQAGATPAGGQSQAIVQSAPTTQSSTAEATSTQSAPTNSGVVVVIDPFASSPDGTGGLGLLITIWIPAGDPVRAGPVTQTTSSTATAAATNTNAVTQTASQTQSGGSQSGGGGQSQTVVQEAPTSQTSVAQATATEGGVGSTSEIIDPKAPTWHSGGGTTFTTGGWSPGRWIGFGATRWSAPTDRGSASSSPRLRRSLHPTEHRRIPMPQSPDREKASLGAGVDRGGSDGGLALFLLAFALTAPWWARRHLPSALRRLMAVVSRLERPG
jgi:hypothetical protein